ncbi:hypothetical protein AB0953_11265 [Streptomyces sp. NPDC046866]|uniref:hypothetical protein n=1 Tax=Streptomyces sp. NPDC046866 TaxID=3154921 RepID=UPI0034567FD7
MVAGRRIRFSAALAVVVLSLTGFSSGHGKHGSGGHGCSSSKSHGSSSDSNSTSSTSGSSKNKKSDAPAHATVVSCAAPGRTKAVLQVTSDLDTQRTVDVPLTFEGNAGTVDRTSVRVTLKPRETQTVTVPMVNAGKVGDVQRCQVGKIT